MKNSFENKNSIPPGFKFAVILVFCMGEPLVLPERISKQPKSIARHPARLFGNFRPLIQAFEVLPGDVEGHIVHFEVDERLIKKFAPDTGVILRISSTSSPRNTQRFLYGSSRFRKRSGT